MQPDFPGGKKKKRGKKERGGASRAAERFLTQVFCLVTAERGRSALDLGLGKAGFATCSLAPHNCSPEKALLPAITAAPARRRRAPAIQTASTSAAGGDLNSFGEFPICHRTASPTNHPERPLYPGKSLTTPGPLVPSAHSSPRRRCRAEGVLWGAAPTPWRLRVGWSAGNSPLPAPQIGFPAPWEARFPSFRD